MKILNKLLLTGTIIVWTLGILGLIGVVIEANQQIDDGAARVQKLEHQLKLGFVAVQDQHGEIKTVLPSELHEELAWDLYIVASPDAIERWEMRQVEIPNELWWRPLGCAGFVACWYLFLLWVWWLRQ